jgi:hypothetical protein
MNGFPKKKGLWKVRVAKIPCFGSKNEGPQTDPPFNHWKKHICRNCLFGNVSIHSPWPLIIIRKNSCSCPC